jgi:predicted ferric reductase
MPDPASTASTPLAHAGKADPARRRYNWTLWVLALIPLAIALTRMQPFDFASPGAVLNLLGRLTGIAGLSFLLVAGILSCRVPGFDRPFGGLTKLWQTHHKLGGVAFLLLFAHPILLSLAAAEVSIGAAAQTLLPPQAGWPLWTGWIALLTMMIFLAPSFSFFGDPKYQRWLFVHRLSAVAIVAALAHTFLLARTIPEPLNSLLWLLLALAAVAAVSWRLVFAYRVGRLKYTVEDLARPANNIVELTLRPEGRHLEYAAGQFVYLAPYDRRLSAGYAEAHPYTLSSAPGEPRLRIAIKDLGDASRALQSVERESEVRIEGPYGDFFPRTPSTERELWVAGGIGITPFLGRLRHLVATGAALDAHLVYCVQDEARAHFADELRGLAGAVPGMQFTVHHFHREGPLSAQFLERHCRDFAERQVYACGPQPLLDCIHAILAALGVPRSRITTEEFTLL